MQQQVLFVQGGGEDGYHSDMEMVASLTRALGSKYKVHYPELSSDENLSDFGWPEQIGTAIDAYGEGVILVGHSLGASLLLKYLSENKISVNPAAIFLLATPFWSGDRDWVQGLKLPANFPGHLSKVAPLFLYHCKDDDEVSFDHLALYQHKLPWATVRELETGGHLFHNDLSMIAKDIKTL